MAGAAGDRVGEYILQDQLGQGTFGTVWRARHHMWADREVAVKLPTDSQYLRNLQREGVAVHGLHHPNVVRAIGFDPYAERPYLAMELVPGTSLRALMQQRRLTPDESVAVMRQVLAGLAYAHGRGVVHRDIKPENVLIHERALTEGFGAEGVVKVTDFGLGKAASAAGLASIAYSASLDDPAGRELAGTLDYMAPEQRTGGAAVDGRADLYACGVVLFEMLTGQRPAGAELPSEVNPDVPGLLDEAFRRSCARLEKRFASAEQFLEFLNRHGDVQAAAGASPGPKIVSWQASALPYATPDAARRQNGGLPVASTAWLRPRPFELTKPDTWTASTWALAAAIVGFFALILIGKSPAFVVGGLLVLGVGVFVKINAARAAIELREQRIEQAAVAVSRGEIEPIMTLRVDYPFDRRVKEMANLAVRQSADPARAADLVKAVDAALSGNMKVVLDQIRKYPGDPAFAELHPLAFAILRPNYVEAPRQNFRFWGPDGVGTRAWLQGKLVTDLSDHGDGNWEARIRTPRGEYPLLFPSALGSIEALESQGLVRGSGLRVYGFIAKDELRYGKDLIIDPVEAWEVAP